MHRIFVQEVLTKWLQFLEKWEHRYSDNHESQILLNIHRILKELINRSSFISGSYPITQLKDLPHF